MSTPSPGERVRGPVVAQLGRRGGGQRAGSGQPEPTTAPLDGIVQAEVTRRYGIVFLDTDV